MNTDAEEPVTGPAPGWYDEAEEQPASNWSTPAPVPVTAPPAPLDLLAAAASGAEMPVSPPLAPAAGYDDDVLVGEPAAPVPPKAGRIVVGLAALAAERLRVGPPARDRFVVGVGLAQHGMGLAQQGLDIAQQTVAEVRGLARRVTGPPTRVASRTIGWAGRRAGLRRESGLLARYRERMGSIVGAARNAGTATVSTGRAEADQLIRSGVNQGLGWAESQAVPQIVDSLVPHLVESVVPRLIDGVMPEIRARVLPVIIDDLTNDPRLRDLVMEQSRDVVGEAAQHVRSATATADDRVELAFRRLIGAVGADQEESRNGSDEGARRASRDG